MTGRQFFLVLLSFPIELAIVGAIGAYTESWVVVFIGTLIVFGILFAVLQYDDREGRRKYAEHRKEYFAKLESEYEEAIRSGRGI